MSTPEQSVENGEASAAVPVVKDMAKAGDACVPSNPKSLGYGVQKIKLEYWEPENEEFWNVSASFLPLRKAFCFSLCLKLQCLEIIIIDACSEIYLLTFVYVLLYRMSFVNYRTGRGQGYCYT